MGGAESSRPLRHVPVSVNPPAPGARTGRGASPPAGGGKVQGHRYGVPALVIHPHPGPLVSAAAPALCGRSSISTLGSGPGCRGRGPRAARRRGVPHDLPSARRDGAHRPAALRCLPGLGLGVRGGLHRRVASRLGAPCRGRPYAGRVPAAPAVVVRGAVRVRDALGGLPDRAVFTRGVAPPVVAERRRSARNPIQGLDLARPPRRAGRASCGSLRTRASSGWPSSSAGTGGGAGPCSPRSRWAPPATRSTDSW